MSSTILLLGACLAACGASTGHDPSDVLHPDTADGADSFEAEVSPVPAPPRIHADGTRLVDATGAEVRLMGANLGGWIFHESWITQSTFTTRGRVHEVGVRLGHAEAVEAALIAAGRDEGAPGWYGAVQAALAERIGEAQAAAVVAEAQSYPSLQDDSDLLLRRELARRFGTAGRDELSDVFQRAWLREADVAWLAGQGFNVVRVPMSWRNLSTDPDDDRPSKLTWNELAFARVDDLLEWCERQGVYAVLDLQESPGDHNGYSGEARLYDDPAMQALTVQLWEELSRRYHARDVVAAYSLLAEPFGAPNSGARDAMYDRLVKAVRARGDDHLLVIHDGFFGMSSLPLPADRDWTGVVYSTHIFEFDATSLEDFEQIVNGWHDPVFTKAQARQGVPYYIGSFSTREDEPWAYGAAQLLIDWYTRHGWSWSVWTLKRIEDPLDWKLWGVRSSYGVLGRLASTFVRPDVQRDDFDTLRARFAAYADLVVDPNEELLGILKSGLPRGTSAW
jgi:aryl-phospho-beta-D-glucosidase BglC (GH1 family)